MSQKIRQINVRGFQNVESMISALIKEEPYMRIKKVSLEGFDLRMEFEDEPNAKISSYVKQISKKKYASLDQFIAKNYGKYGSMVGVINLPKMWLMFFNKR